MTAHHQDQPIRAAGTPLEEASAAAVMLHGRGARAESILGLASEFGVEGVTYLAPQAARNTWYPNSFMATIDSNEPWLTSALQRVGETIERATDAGIPRERVLVGGFSQGACLGTECVARNATRYGGVAALSGGLIGPHGTPRDYEGSLDGTPAFVGCSDVDPHIPVERVHKTTEVLSDLGAEVDERIYEGMSHTINEEERRAVAEMVERLVTD